MNKMSSQDIAYMAGIFDGEGWFVTNKSTGPRAAIAMTDFDVVEKLHEKTGIGRLEGPRSTRSGRKPQLTWIINKHYDVEDFIYAILPFLSHRRTERAKEVLADIEERRARRIWRESYFVCGHEKIEENTYHTNQGKTVCRTCNKNRPKKKK